MKKRVSTPHERAREFLYWTSSRQQARDTEWPGEAWSKLCSLGVTRWTIPTAYGGDELSPGELLDGCLELARGELLVTFVLSQFQSSCQRLVVADSESLKQRWLPNLATGTKFTTVGISHLTTSRQHTSPAVKATNDGDGYRLTGQIPWVTGGRHADVLVVGGTLEDGRQILAGVPAGRQGVSVDEPTTLLALTGSETGPVTLDDAAVNSDELIAGPVTGVMQHAGRGGAGSLMTSTLALGHAFGCLDHFEREVDRRPALNPVFQALSSEAETLRRDLVAAADPQTVNPLAAEQLRTRTTDLALRSSQALVTATKGAGFVVGHPAERRVREAIFFLVWSCPQAVSTRLLNTFSGCENDE